MRQKILVIDDEKDILRLLEHNLGKAGFNVISASDGLDGLDIARKELPDLIILDVMLPNMEGTEVLKLLKKDNLTDKIPVIMLTAKGEELDRVVGLELGADDYIIKPFSPKELLLRVNVLLKKKHREDEANIIKSGLLFIDTDRFMVTINGKRVDFTAAEFKFLVELVNSKGRLLDREYLVKMVCSSDTHVSFRNIDTHIRRLRIKLGQYSGCIETVRGLGYRFKEDELNGKNRVFA
ncbi:MAG: response regulator transcription factor [Deltaproteobacteria bacterium]|nr:response regulator transcription factor [Deltaproteobacteria bacterium]